jgi:hypothetical protein
LQWQQQQQQQQRIAECPQQLTQTSTCHHLFPLRPPSAITRLCPHNHTRFAQVRPFPAVSLLLADSAGAQQLLKVGYVSATGFQGNTTTARFMQRIFSLHDASRIEVICIARAADDGTSERAFIKEGCKDWLQFEKNDLCA